MKPVWIVDDDQAIRWVLEKALSRAGIPTRSFAGAVDVAEAPVTAAKKTGALTKVENASVEELNEASKGTSLDYLLARYVGDVTLIKDGDKLIAVHRLSDDTVWDTQDRLVKSGPIFDFAKTAGKKTAACPTCGAAVLQNGQDTNGQSCPNCANKPSNQPTQPGQPAPVAPRPVVPQNGPAKPSPVKQYGSLFKGLTLASGE